jgi:RimJ/RimL family protein N-acetyltransferase
MIKFELLVKNNFEKTSKNIFAILANNMSDIAPTGNTYEEDYNMWYKNMNENLKNDKRNIVLVIFNDLMIGYFQYNTNVGGLFMMEEIQILPEYQGGKYNIFRKLYGFVFSILPKNIKTVEAYVNKRNRKSQNILLHLGLYCIGENKNGSSFHYKGSFEDIKKWYNFNNSIGR